MNKAEWAENELKTNGPLFKNDYAKYSSRPSEDLHQLLSTRKKQEYSDRTYRAIETVLILRKDPKILEARSAPGNLEDSRCIGCDAELNLRNKVFGKDVCADCHKRGNLRACFICSKVEKGNYRISNVFRIAGCEKHFVISCCAILVLGLGIMVAGAWYGKVASKEEGSILVVIGSALLVDGASALQRKRILI